MATNRQQDSEQSAAEDECFRARMQAQCDAIEAYRLQVIRSEHRALSLEQAAQEWIARYAKGFSSRWQHQHH